jgi:peroxiredoxin
LTDPGVAAEVWLNLGRDYRSSAELDRAAACFRNAIALEADPRLADAARTALRALGRLAVGRAAPGFHSTDLQGRQVSLSELAGKFVLLVFWSCECTACIPELDHLRWVRAAYPAEQLAFIGVALDARADPVRRFVDLRGMDWPQVFDGQGLDGPVPRLYEVREGPRSFLIDPEGLIVARDISGKELDALLAQLLPKTGTGAPDLPTANGRPAHAATGQVATPAHRD